MTIVVAMLLGVALLGPVQPAKAQGPTQQQPDVVQIVQDLLRGIQERLDAIEKRLNRIEAQASTPTPTPAPTATASAAASANPNTRLFAIPSPPNFHEAGVPIGSEETFEFTIEQAGRFIALTVDDELVGVTGSKCQKTESDEKIPLYVCWLVSDKIFRKGQIVSVTIRNTEGNELGVWPQLSAPIPAGILVPQAAVVTPTATPVPTATVGYQVLDQIDDFALLDPPWHREIVPVDTSRTITLTVINEGRFVAFTVNDVLVASPGNECRIVPSAELLTLYVCRRPPGEGNYAVGDVVVVEAQNKFGDELEIWVKTLARIPNSFIDP